MNKYFDLFIKKNKKIINTFDNERYIIAVDRNRYLASIITSIMLSAIGNKLKLNPIILSDTKNKNITKVYKSFGFTNFYRGFRYTINFLKFSIVAKSLFLTLLCIINTKFKGFAWFIKNFTVKKIKIGDLIYDTYIKKGNNYINPKIDFDLINLIFTSIYRTLNIIEIFKKIL